MSDLNNEFAKLKEYSSQLNIDNLNKRIYELNLDDKYLSSLSQDKLQYIHVKLHNALSYKKPFKDINEIKKAHDRIVPLMKNHQKVDKLDEK